MPPVSDLHLVLVVDGPGKGRRSTPTVVGALVRASPPDGGMAVPRTRERRARDDRSASGFAIRAWPGWGIRAGREEEPGATRESRAVDLGAGVVGLLADWLSGRSPTGSRRTPRSARPLLARVPFSPRLPLVRRGDGAARARLSGLAFGFTLEAAIAAFFCWVARRRHSHRLRASADPGPDRAARARCSCS